jgi:hypothetical protein
MARLALSSLILLTGCAVVPAPDYRSLISCELAIATLEKPAAVADVEPATEQAQQAQPRKRWRLLRRR